MQKPFSRLCIYFIYDREGIVDRYILYMLSAMREQCTELAVVSNGQLESISKKEISCIADHVFIRENVGFDVWAYRMAIEQYGWEYLEQFDEVVFMNYTIMGPVYPIEEVFSSMNNRDVDFWGLTTFHQLDHDPFGKCKYGYIPLHLQSHFIAVRKRMVKSKDFHNYWESVPMIKSYEEAVCFHEAIFTKEFELLGYKWDSYVNTEDLYKHNCCPILYTPVKIIREKRCPIFKRRSFFHEYDGFLSVSLGQQGSELLAFLREQTEFDTDMIWENILRLENLADIYKCLHLNYFLSNQYVSDMPAKKKIALIMHLYYEDLFQSCYHYALSMPEYADIYLTTTSEDKKESIERLFHNGPWGKVDVRLIPNRGRDVSALLVEYKDIVPDYDYICFMHDKKSSQNAMQSIGDSFSYHCYENNISNRNYVLNVIQLFEDNPRLGLLSPPPPYHANYYITIGNEWGENYHLTKELAKRMGLTVNISEKKAPIAPLGTMFWFRGTALQPLFNLNWKYSDFPTEPVSTDGTLLHAIERLYPFVAQQQGFYSAWCISDGYAKLYATNYYHLLETLNSISFKIFGINGSYELRLLMQNYLKSYGSESIKNQLLRHLIKNKLRTFLPPGIWNIIKKIYKRYGGEKWVSK